MMTEPPDAAVMQQPTERTPPSTPPLQSIAWPARFIALASIWGLSFVFIKVGLASFAPLQVAALRLAFGAATLLTLVAATGDRLPRRRRTWLHLIFATLFMNVAPF